VPEETEVRRRPGGRSARIRQSVLDATLATVAEVGVEKLSVADVATRAAVHETSIYRRWRTRENLIIDALLNYSERHLPIPDTGSLRGDLVDFGVELVAYLATPLGRALAQTMANIPDEPAIAEARNSFWQTRYELASAMIDRAIERGELEQGTDPRLLLEALVAPLHLRTLMTREPPEADLPQRLVDVLLDGAIRGSR
jgi:AcrR family transcriptional regulator